MTNTLIVPFCLYKLISEATQIEPCMYVSDNELLLKDEKGRVHSLTYHGLLIETPSIFDVEL